MIYNDVDGTLPFSKQSGEKILGSIDEKKYEENNPSYKNIREKIKKKVSKKLEDASQYYGQLNKDANKDELYIL